MALDAQHDDTRWRLMRSMMGNDGERWALSANDRATSHAHTAQHRGRRTFSPIVGNSLGRVSSHSESSLPPACTSQWKQPTLERLKPSPCAAPVCEQVNVYVMYRRRGTWHVWDFQVLHMGCMRHERWRMSHHHMWHDMRHLRASSRFVK